jgi:peptidyl-prolyl cis-trans isomerase B (cyclophilin B)
MKPAFAAALSGLLLLTLAPWAGTAPLPAKFLEPPDTVVMETSLGRITLKLFPDKAPLTVANFLRYVDDHFYDDTVIHRVIPNFMAQGGGLDAALTEKKGRDPVINESANGLGNKRGTLAAARAADPDSATSQFFINAKDNAFLDRASAHDKAGYCVFGEVTAGMDVVDRVMQVPTGPKGGHQDVPLQPVFIKSIRRVGPR